jgi:formate dehydrogenase beta subunit
MGNKFNLDGTEIEAPEDRTILEAALGAGVYIPHLCYHPDLPAFKSVQPAGSCFQGKERIQSDSQEEGYK